MSNPNSLFGKVASWIEALEEDVLKPFIKKELGYLAADLEASAPTLEAAASAQGSNAVTAITTFIQTEVSQNALLSLVSAQLMPEAVAALSKLAAEGAADVPNLIKGMAAWLIAEEANL